MYQFLSAYLLTSGGWERSVDIANETLENIFKTQRLLYLNVNETIHDVVMQIDLMTLKPTLISDQRTISQWLLDNGDTVIPTLSVPKRLDKLHHHRYTDSSHNVCKVKPVKAGFSYHPETVSSKTPDLLVEGPFNATNSICSVNGFLHYIENIPTGTTVFNGYLSMLNGKVLQPDYHEFNEQNQYGFHDFSDVCSIIQHRITTDIISVSGLGITIKTQVDLRNATPLLVLGGYLFTLNHVLSVIGDHTLLLETNAIDWPSMILNSENTLETDYLALTRLPGSKAGIVVSEVFDVDTIVRYLTGPYSFLVYLIPHDDTQPLARTDYLLEDVGTGVGKYIALLPPTGILTDELGRVVNYETQPDDGDYVVSIYPCLVNRYEYHQAPWRSSSVVDNTRDAPTKRTTTPLIKNINFYQLG